MITNRLEGTSVEFGDELAAKDLTQNRLGQEVVVPRVDPAGVIEREAARGNDDMEMRMEPEFWNFFASLFYGEDDPEAPTLNYVNAGYNGPVRSKEAEHAIWDPDAKHNNHPLRCVRYRAEGCTPSVGR